MKNEESKLGQQTSLDEACEASSQSTDSKCFCQLSSNSHLAVRIAGTYSHNQVIGRLRKFFFAVWSENQYWRSSPTGYQ